MRYVHNTHVLQIITIFTHTQISKLKPIFGRMTTKQAKTITGHTLLSCLLLAADRKLGEAEGLVSELTINSEGLDNFWTGVNSPWNGAQLKYLHNRSTGFTLYFNGYAGIKMAAFHSDISWEAVNSSSRETPFQSWWASPITWNRSSVLPVLISVWQSDMFCARLTD